MSRGQLGSPVTFSNLAANTRYEIRCYAYALDDNSQEVLISESGQSTTAVDVGNDNMVEVTIVVKLGDSDFVGTGTATLSIIPGTYTSAGSPSITISTPAPTPPPSLQASFVGGNFGTVASIVSIVGGTVGNNYMLSLDRTETSPGSSIYDYTLHWGADGSMTSAYLGTSWPPTLSTIAAPNGSGAGTLALAWLQTPPTGDTTAGTVAITTAP